MPTGPNKSRSSCSLQSLQSPEKDYKDYNRGRTASAVVLALVLMSRLPQELVVGPLLLFIKLAEKGAGAF